VRGEGVEDGEELYACCIVEDADEACAAGAEKKGGCGRGI
jgi:hypothetical protein